MENAIGLMFRLPFSMLAFCVEMLAQTLRGMQHLADESLQATTGAPPREIIVTPGVEGEGAANEGKENIMPDKDLSNDKVKLVQYSIVSIQRGLERTLWEAEKIVSDNMTGEAFATWMIAEYIQAEEEWEKYPERYPHRHPGWKRVEHESKKYLRVYYSVLDQWEREDLHYEEKQLVVLQGIENAIRECCEKREHA